MAPDVVEVWPSPDWSFGLVTPLRGVTHDSALCAPAVAQNALECLTPQSGVTRMARSCEGKITDLAKEARKYGLGLILSSQETRDFHPSIFANAGTQIVLALEDADASIMAKVYAADKKDQGVVKNLIIGQESGVALIRSTHFQPYWQVRISSFKDRVASLGEQAP